MRKSKVFWGVFLLLCAAAIFILAFSPDTVLGQISLWKIIAGLLLLYWAVDCLFFSSRAKDKIDAIIPLTIGLLIFEKELAKLLNIKGDLYSNWLIIVGAIVLSIGLHTIFDPLGKKNGNTKPKDNKFTSSAIYIDATKTDMQFVSNKFGAIDIYFENTDIGDTSLPVQLDISNIFGTTSIHVPSSWIVENKVNASFADVSVRADPSFGRILTHRKL